MADSSVAITAGSGTPIRVLTNLGAGGADQQVISLADSNGFLNPSDPDGTLQMSGNDPTTLLLDSFDTGTLGNWTTGGTAPTVSTGQIAFSSATTASTIGYLRSNGAFNLMSQAYLRISYMLKLETTAAITNSTRWWGYGTNQAAPTAAAPVVTGAVFLLDYVAGAFQAAYYAGGTKTVVATLTKPTDGLQHKYEIWYKQSTTYWVVDGVTVATASNAGYTVVSGQNLIAGSAVFTSAASAAPTLIISSISVSDSGRNNQQLSDGLLPWIKGTVKSGANPAPAATDNPLYVEALQIPSTTVTATAATGTAVTATLAAPGAGLRHYITSIVFEQYATAATTGAATPIVSTASNHNLVATFPTALAIGTVNKDVRPFNSALASLAQNTATSFTLPLTTGIIWRITVSYYIAP